MAKPRHLFFGLPPYFAIHLMNISHPRQSTSHKERRARPNHVALQRIHCYLTNPKVATRVIRNCHIRHFTNETPRSLNSFAPPPSPLMRTSGEKLDGVGHVLLRADCRRHPYLTRLMPATLRQYTFQNVRNCGIKDRSKKSNLRRSCR